MKTTFENQTTQIVNSVTSNEVFCNDGTKDITNGKKPPCINNGGVKVTVGSVNVPQGVAQVKQTFLQRNQTMLIAIGVPVGFYAFSKYQKFDNKKTAKVTIIGSVVVLGAIVINGLSGMWSGNTYAKRIFGKQNAPKQILQKQIVPTPV
jgi:hypothetical protein